MMSLLFHPASVPIRLAAGIRWLRGRLCLLALVLALPAHGELVLSNPRAAQPVKVMLIGETLVFTGMCDGSAAVALDADLFVAASDEDNILRFYRRSQPGKPVSTYNLNQHLAGRKKSPEADIEGAARLGQRVFWITSHGRDAAGERLPNRCRLFAVEITNRGALVVVQPVGRVYSDLIADLAREPRRAGFQLAEAAKRWGKSPGQLNIEALTATPEGTLLIGFRTPIPGGHALLVPLLNPNELLASQPPRFGEPILLDLGGLGLRGMGWTGRAYYLIAGAGEGRAESCLYVWPGGTAAPRPVAGVSFAGFTPEAICFQDAAGRGDFLVLSDDGNRKVDGKENSDLSESRRQFRALRIVP
jgi:hypothetical protein